MAKTLERYTELLPPVPHEWPGVYRWTVRNSTYGYPHLHLEVYKEKTWLMKARWKSVAAQQILKDWDHWSINRATASIMGEMRSKYGQNANIVMAERI